MLVQAAGSSPHASREDSALWSLLGGSLPGSAARLPLDPAHPLWSRSKRSIHELRALLTLLTPGAHVRDIFETSCFWFLKAQLFFLIIITKVFRLEMLSFTPLNSWDIVLVIFLFFF